MNEEERRERYRREEDRRKAEIAETVSDQVQSAVAPLAQMVHAIQKETGVRTQQIADITKTLRNLDKKMDDYHDEAKKIAEDMKKDSEKVKIFFDLYTKFNWGQKTAWWFLKAILWIAGFVITTWGAIKIIRST